ncbi:MAG: NAD(P)/FAD-dependent oxidoreductase [Myxococcales bacterium]|nr:NAD(P)/FAD-dependent oxidoreductase [Myxococcales bacterium]
MPPHPSLQSHYDVVIVGGRPAGASLAARLGAHHISTLVVDRARFPSMPAVPSCAMLYPHHMRMVEELGIDEDAFLDPSARCRRFVVEVDGRFDAVLPMIESNGRDYVGGIDRDRFDHCLWRNLERHGSVTGSEATSLLDVRRDEAGAVCGVRLRTPDGSVRDVAARCVVGADGRFSTLARKVGAQARESFDLTSTAHFATWEGVLPHDDADELTVSIYATGRGFDVLFFPAPGGRIHVCTHVRSDRMRSEGSVEDYYLRTIQSLPTVRRRLEPATRLTDVVGVKRIANGYREPGGAGWVLVGDALHYKDPIDGQGIYDALLGAKLLAEELVAWHEGAQSLAQAVAAYDRRLLDQTHPMYEATTKRIQRELYDEPPSLVLDTLVRWTMNDPVYKRRFLEYLCRAIPPQTWLTPTVTAGAIARGIYGDLRRLLPRRRAPAGVPSRR